MRKRQAVCVNCGAPVKVVAGARPERHEGHVESRLDSTCGTWGFKRVKGSV